MITPEAIATERAVLRSHDRYRELLKRAAVEMANLVLHLEAGAAGRADVARRLIRLGGLGLLVQKNEERRAAALARAEAQLDDEVKRERGRRA